MATTNAGPHLFWITSRAAGTAALVLASLAVCLGLLMSTRLRRSADFKASLWRATSGTDVTSVASPNRDYHAAPLILDGGVYFATQSNNNGGTTHLTRYPLASNGGLGDAGVTDQTSPGVPYFGLVTDAADGEIRRPA